MQRIYAVAYQKFVFFTQRLASASLACAFWMTQGDMRALTLQHWRIALQTAFFSSTVLLLISFSKFRWVQEGFLKRFVCTALIVAIVDYCVHPSHFGGFFGEAAVTGLTAAGLLEAFGLLISFFS